MANVYVRLAQDAKLSGTKINLKLDFKMHIN